jgi:hypothetical protein
MKHLFSSLLVLVVLCMTAFQVSARSIDPKGDSAAIARVRVKMDEIRKHRPTVALVLSGGGAKGAAHVGAIKYIEQLGIPVVEEPFTVEELMNADEVFFSSSSALTCRVGEIDGQPVGLKDEVTFAKIRDAYQALVKQDYGK